MNTDNRIEKRKKKGKKQQQKNLLIYTVFELRDIERRKEI